MLICLILNQVEFKVTCILGIESSCDETGIAIYDSQRGLCADVLYSQVKQHAVYGGVVSSVIIIPGAGKAIIIAHGSYRTIYSNLQESYVQKGDKVAAKQEIGSLLINASGTMSEVHFEIRQITTEGDIKNLNPSYWLFK